MLVNLSNHPLNTWSNKQVAIAENEYGKIIDFTFPQINPDAEEAEIDDLSEKTLQKIIDTLQTSSDKNNAVHLMGELTFVFSLANKLISNNIKVIASTTKREALQTKQGKLSKFNFVKFRQFKHK